MTSKQLTDALNRRIYVVTGFARSGTSLMMRMLHAGGIEPYCDGQYISYETHFACLLPEEHLWLDGCEGKAVKVLEPQRYTPPPGRCYAFIWMTRNSLQQAMSQIKFLSACFPGAIDKSRAKIASMKAGIDEDTPIVQSMLRMIPPLSTLIVISFEDVLKNPENVTHRLAGYTGLDLNTKAMVKCVRQRSPKCLPHLEEINDIRKAEGGLLDNLP